MCKVVFNIYWFQLCSRPLITVMTNSWEVVIASVFWTQYTQIQAQRVFCCCCWVYFMSSKYPQATSYFFFLQTGILFFLLKPSLARFFFFCRCTHAKCEHLNQTTSKILFILMFRQLEELMLINYNRVNLQLSLWQQLPD